ncbi:LPXTG cell wall anchor domain-containing protein, partial [candidate division WWE3 bacterium]|nr:LPXTG cell wall anchor domain-containing protein [candidate division WWE3 bacterium]
TNSVKDIFVYDLELQTIERVSVDDGGDEGNNHSQYPTISDDGRYVVFQSAATNLVASDTNNLIDIFLHDRNTDTTTRLSLDSADGESDGHSLYPAISGDGQFVAFNSVATDLVADDTNGVGDVFLRNLNTDTTTRISVHTDGSEATGRSEHPSIDEIGRYIAYESEASDLVDGDTNGYRDVFVRDTHLNVTQRVSVSSTGAEGNNISGDTVDKPNGRLSANGQYVAFKSRASNLVDGDTNGIVDVFVYDRQTGQTARVSTDSLGSEANDASYYPSISDDGRYIGFWSYATNLVNGDTNGVGDVFVYDRDSLTPTLTPTGTPAITAAPSSSSTVTLSQNTSSPTEVTISTSAGDVYVRCENVTTGGDLTVQVYNTPPGQLTDGFTILPTNFDLSTSDVVCDYITVCLPYSTEEANAVGLAEGDLQLWHFMSNWQNVTSTIDTLNDRACGAVEELSPFVIGVNTSVTGIPTSTTNTSTPSSLPNTGINAPTFALLFGGLVVLAGGFYLIVQPKSKS